MRRSVSLSPVTGSEERLGPVWGFERLAGARRMSCGRGIITVSSAGQSAARLFCTPLSRCSLTEAPIRDRGQGPDLNTALSTVALPAGDLVPFEAETWGPLEHEPERIPDVPPDWIWP